MRCFLWALDYGQNKNTFYGISAYFKHNFCLAPWWKINWPRLIFFYISTLKSLSLVLILSEKLNAHWGTWTYIVFLWGLLRLWNCWHCFSFSLLFCMAKNRVGYGFELLGLPSGKLTEHTWNYFLVQRMFYLQISVLPIFFF